MSAWGAKIRQLRRARGYGLNEFAELVGVSRGYLSQLERGVKQKPSAALLARIADGLGISVDEFFRGAPEAAREPKAEYGSDDVLKALRNLLRKLPDLTPSDRSEIMDFIEFKRTRTKRTRR